FARAPPPRWTTVALKANDVPGDTDKHWNGPDKKMSALVIARTYVPVCGALSKRWRSSEPWRTCDAGFRSGDEDETLRSSVPGMKTSWHGAIPPLGTFVRRMRW